MIIPIKILIPSYKEKISLFDGQVVIRKISAEELKNIYGVEVIFEYQKPKRITSLPNRVNSPYERLYSPEYVAFYVDSFCEFPYFVIEASSAEITSDLLFILRVLKKEPLLAPFGFENNYISSVFYPTITTKKFNRYYELNKNELSDLFKLTKYLKVKRGDSKYQIIKERYLNTLHANISNKLKYLEWVQIIESIILTKNNKDNLSARFKNQLHRNIRDVTCSQAEKIYDNRCRLAHSGRIKYPINEGEKKYSLNNVHTYVQKIVRAYIKGEITNEN